MRNAVHVHHLRQLAQIEQFLFRTDAEGREFLLPIAQIPIRNGLLEAVLPWRILASAETGPGPERNLRAIADGRRQLVGIEIEDLAQRRLAAREAINFANQ